MAKVIKYESENGYRGILEGIELTVKDRNGKTRFHTCASNCRTEKDLKQFVDEFPEFLEMLSEVVRDE